MFLIKLAFKEPAAPQKLRVVDQFIICSHIVRRLIPELIALAAKIQARQGIVDLLQRRFGVLDLLT